MKVDVARRRDRGTAWVETLERRFQILVDGMVLTYRVHVAQVEVRGEPRRVVVCDPHRDRGMVLQHRDHLGLLLPGGALEEAGLVSCFVEAQARLPTKGVWDEPLGGQLWTVEVASSQSRATNVQLTWRTDRH